MYIKSTCAYSGPSRPLGTAALRRIAVAAILGSALACATGPPPVPRWNHPEVKLVWPERPDRARIEYLGSLRTPADLGRRAGWFERVKTALFGAKPAALLKPIAVAKNRSGMLVVTDPSLPAVHLFDLERREYRQLGTGADSVLRSPIGVAIND